MLVLVLVLGSAEQLHQDAVVQINQFIRDGGHAFQRQRDQRGVASLALEFAEVLWRHLSTLSRQFEQAILVDVAADAFRQRECLEGLEAFDVLQHVPGIRFQRGLAQPNQPGDVVVRLDLQQRVEPTPMLGRQWFDQRPINASIGVRHGFRTGAFDDGQRG